MSDDAMPVSWLPPMLATLGEEATTPASWPVEPKWDGVRCLAVLDPVEGVTLWSRARRELTFTFPEIAEALAERACGFGVLDGELVARGSRPYGDFGLIQQRLGRSDALRARATGVAVTYQVFDVLWWDGVDRRPLPWRERHALVRRTAHFGGLIARTPSWSRGRRARFAAICAAGGEGLIAKRPDAPYQSIRSSDWVKLKCQQVGDFVVGGWTAPQGGRVGVGALLLGAWERGALRYVGRVGTGLTDAELAAARVRLERRETAKPPFANAPREPARWVRPEMVARVRFTEWTRDGRLRHPSFLGWVPLVA